MEKCLEFRAQGSMRPRLSSRDLLSKSVDFLALVDFQGVGLSR